MASTPTLRTARAIVALTAVVALTACTTTSDTRDGTAAVTGGTLSVVGPVEVHSLEPATSSELFTRLQVSETLVATDADGALRAGLATGWHADDDTTWRFELRPTAVFHDGEPVTADAVVAALQIAYDKEGSPLTGAPVAEIGVDGDDIVVRLDEPFASLPAVLAHTSTQVLAPSSYDEDGAVTEVIGSGPYAISAVHPPQRIEVTASEHWDGTAPAITDVTYQAVSRAESRALMAESGQSDVTLGMDPVSLQRLQDVDGVQIHSVTLPRTIQMKVNGEHPALGDPLVRQALSAALDRQGMATALLRDPEMAATQLFPPSLADWHQDDLTALEHDADEARRLLAEAGWEEGPDGILVRDGERFEITLRTFPDRPELPILATAIQAAFADVGIDLSVSISNSSEIPAGHQDGTLDVGLYARNYALVPDPAVTLLGDFAPEGSDWGAMGWNDEDLTAALEAMAEGLDDAQAADARAQVAQIMQDELPVIPVAWYRQSAVVNERVAGMTLDPLERSWWLSELTWSS
ncbi:ABC transporter substrate-binding protein [Cellulomonas bogoriensis]|uniref:ABC transporter substrate-binding protein n=1 Tax=Cellulomonas bogoriensis 69B4 = DSM 16987 TaxID=1386082 RepID=A0A0A0BVJ2_9CELL|nr:ABC transporter substrate-binding protein [Cellulomonas bogoriensis]KGM12413.1 ABC transporter substrate-binding protein [Cellulomonas bogoriensis 69B4 = DSM 16987]